MTEKATAGDFSGKVAAVTGGGSGIGECCARLLASRGATVVIADINSDRAEQVAESIGGHSLTLDITNPEETKHAVTEIESKFGSVDVAVLSAGIAQYPHPPEDQTMADWDRIVDIDFRGAYLSAIAFGTAMSIQGGGSIVFLGSISGMRSVPLHAYGPAKAAVIAMTSNLAAEWGLSGVRVNCVSPGFTLTPMLQGMIERGERDPDLLERDSALGRLVNGDDVARAVAFLSSDEARAITGVNLPVEAGWLSTITWRSWGGRRPAR